MSQKVYEIAMKNYPQRWNREMLDRLLRDGSLTQEEYDAILRAKGEKNA